MIAVYLDESGQESKGHVVIAGFFGRKEQWDSFLPEWLKAVGCPRFHAQNLRWNRVATKTRVARLAKIPYDHGLTPIRGAVYVPDYSDMFVNSIENAIVAGYVLALYPIIIRLLETVSPDERIKFVFEEQRRYEFSARKVFQNFSHLNAKERIDGIEFLPKEATVLTQPSDLLAFAELQRLRDPKSQKAEWCHPILGDKPILGEVLSRESIRDVLSKSLPAARLKTQVDLLKAILDGSFA
jgi:hypothetical protein